jgi:flagellar hook-associated protein 2
VVSGPVFQAGGLASGLDTMGIVDALVGIEEVRVQRLEQKKLDYTTQLTKLTEVIVSSQELRRTLEDLKEAGISRQVTSSTSQADAKISGDVLDGEYQIQVTNLARAAKARSGNFSSATDVMKEGTLTLDMKGSSYDIDIADGDTLSDVAEKINESAAPVTASVLFDGTNFVLSLTANSTGHTIGDDPSRALTITESYTGATGAELGLAVTQTAENATVIVDGLTFERQSNTVSDVIPGLELSLKQENLTDTETLVVSRDTEATVEKVKAFVDAYNALNQMLRLEINVPPGSNTDNKLTRDPTVRAYARQIDNIMSITSLGSGGLDSLVNIGVERDRLGNISVNESKLRSIIEDSPQELDAFLTGDDGFVARANEMVNSYASIAGGALYRRQDDITTSMDQLTDEQLKIRDNVDRFRERLIKQFAAMEQTVSQYNAIGDYLSSQEARDTKKN